MLAAILSALSYPCHPCHPRSSQPQEIRDLVEQVPTQSLAPLAIQNFLGRDVPAPIPTLNDFGGGDVSSPHVPRLRNQHPLGRDVPAPIQTHNDLGVGDVSSPHVPRLRNQHPLGRDVPAPIPTLNDFGGGDVSSPHVPRLRNQHPLGRDIPAPIQTLHYFGVGDVPSPHLPRARNVRHQFGTSPGLPQPVFKTLKGFQTVAGGKAVRPPPPVPCLQNVQPPPLAEGGGGGGIPESPQAVSPDESRCSTIPRRRKKAQRGSLPRANVLCAGRGPARPRPVLRPSACSAGLRFLPRKLKAEVWGRRAQQGRPTRDRPKNGPRISRISRIGETPHRAGKVAWAGHHPPCRHALPLFPIVPSAVKSTPSGRRRPVAMAPLAPHNSLGRDVPAQTLNYFGARDVSLHSSHGPRDDSSPGSAPGRHGPSQHGRPGMSALRGDASPSGAHLRPCGLERKS